MPISRTNSDVQAPLNSAQAQAIEANFDQLFSDALDEGDVFTGTSPIKFTIGGSGHTAAGGASLTTTSDTVHATSWSDVPSITKIRFNDTDADGVNAASYMQRLTDGSFIFAAFNGGRFAFLLTAAPTDQSGFTTFSGSIAYSKGGTSWPSSTTAVGFGFQIVGTSGGPAGPQGTPGADGDDGWAPEFSIENDGDRRVLKVDDWTGGTGTKPAVDRYVGLNGLVVAIGDGIDIRGPQGLSGPAGNEGGEGPAGTDGTDGTDGNPVWMQYSTDGTSWHDTLASGDTWLRFAIAATRPGNSASTWSIGREFVGSSAAVTRANVYNQVKDIVVGGTNVTATDSDTNRTVTLATSSPVTVTMDDLDSDWSSTAGSWTAITGLSLSVPITANGCYVIQAFLNYNNGNQAQANGGVRIAIDGTGQSSTEFSNAVNSGTTTTVLSTVYMPTSSGTASITVESRRSGAFGTIRVNTPSALLAIGIP